MYFHPGGQVSSKHNDGPGGGGPNGDLSRLGGGGGGSGGAGGLGGWGRNGGFVPGGLPLPVPSGYPSNGMLSQFGAPPPGAHHGGPPHHGHPSQQHGAHGGASLLHHHPSAGGHPHHPSFGGAGGVGNGAGGMHIPGQNGGMGMGGHGGHGVHGPGGFGGMAGFGGGGAGGPGLANSPPGRAQDMPLTPVWQNQLLKAESSRIASSPHHRARSAAMASRMSSKPAAVTISDPNRPSPVAHTSALNGSHRKNTSLSVNDRAGTPELSEASVTPSMGNVDPANPATAPAPTEDAEEKPSEPWHGLDLGGIRLKTLSPGLFSFSHITALYINHNSLTTLPKQISQLRQLTHLDATGNELSSIPPELGVLCKLKELLLFDNLLTTLPYELGTLYQLETLGIEGNPMEDRIRKMLAEQGTTALITYLRDQGEPGPGPPERDWIVIEPDVDDPSTGKQESFTVLTYNILCQQFAPSSTYSYTPNWALEWNYRKQTILDQIFTAAGDIVCLQEIDVGQFNEWFLPRLREFGYEGVHYPRSRAKTMVPDEAKLVDGCATFWKTELFKLVETQVVEFNSVAMQKPDMRTDDMFNRVMSRDNIAVVAELEFVQSGARLLVCNSHIYWDHRYRDVKLVQIGMLMEELEKIVAQYSNYPPPMSNNLSYNNGRGAPKYDRLEKGRDIPLVLCVDLNSLSGSAVYDFLSSGEIPPDHEDFMDHLYGTYTNKGLRHRLALRSAAASFGEMKMTNFTPTFTAAIDYIFYTPRNLKVTSVLGDVDKAYLDKTVGFPNAHFPSDHIPVFAQFRVKGQA